MLSAKQRLAIFYNSALTPSEALAMDDAEINHSKMLAAGCDFQAIMSVLSVKQLNERGFRDPSDFRVLGMDILDLCETEWTRGLIELFCRNAVRAAFLQTGEDAALIAETEVCPLLEISLDALLALCKGCPMAAETVLRGWATRSPAAAIQIHTTVDRLIQTGLCADDLVRQGITIPVLVDGMRATSAQLMRLGLRV